MSELMTRKHGWILLALGFLSAIIAAKGIESPGYMDADYYYSMGLQWAAGRGGEEPFIWNYLNDPVSIPTTSHGYWSPLTAMLAGLAMWLFGEGFASAQIPFILATALLPFLVWRLALAMGLTSGSAAMAGFLALGPGFYLPFFVTSDAFSVYAILGVVLMLTLKQVSTKESSVLWLIAGFTCGFAHLSRADGFLLLVIPIWYMISDRERVGKRLAGVILGYLLVMFPWFLRNMLLHNSMLPSGSTRTLWLLSYDEIFQFPVSGLTFERWLKAGLGEILAHRWSALMVILQRIAGENGLVFLGPFMLIGVLRSWKQVIVRCSIAFGAALIIVMVLIFPFVGARGGWFHSSAALMPLLWVMVPVGLEQSVAWVGQRRGWDIPRASTVFRTAAVILALVLTWGLYIFRVYGLGAGGEPWDAPAARYEDVHRIILARDPSPEVIAINNPPGFYHTTGVHTVVLPNGGLNALEEVVERYAVSWIVLDRNHPSGYGGLYRQTDSLDGLTYETTVESHGASFILYRVNGNKP